MDRRDALSRLPALCLLGSAMAGLAAGTGGCAANAAVAVGMHPWPGYETLRLAGEFGWLPQPVRLVEFNNSTETRAGLKGGQLDAGCLTLDEVLLARAEGLSLVVIAVFDESVGADMVVARPALRRLEDLAGKRIAVERSAVGGLMLVKLLEAAGLGRDAATVIDLPPDQHPAAWRADHIDASVCYEPVASEMLALGGKRMFDSRRIPGMIVDVLAVREDRLAGRAVSSARLSCAGSCPGCWLPGWPGRSRP